jgi:hypothetical protein
METEITAEQFYERLNKIQEDKVNPNISPDNPLMICIRCNGRYTLPLPYDECNPQFRDYCPDCIIDVYERELNRMENDKEALETAARHYD